jgi:predicted RNA binding protein YcfA (HicA-like mRNA interferase family)
MLRHAGFVMRPGKGSHTNWQHPAVPGTEVTVSGHDGADAHRYQEVEVRKVIAKAKGSA